MAAAAACLVLAAAAAAAPAAAPAPGPAPGKNQPWDLQILHFNDNHARYSGSRDTQRWLESQQQCQTLSTPPLPPRAALHGTRAPRALHELTAAFLARRRFAPADYGFSTDCDGPKMEACFGGMARQTAAIKAERAAAAARGVDTLTLHAGDQFSGRLAWQMGGQTCRGVQRRERTPQLSLHVPARAVPSRAVPPDRTAHPFPSQAPSGRTSSQSRTTRSRHRCCGRWASTPLSSATTVRLMMPGGLPALGGPPPPPPAAHRT